MFFFIVVILMVWNNVFIHFWGFSYTDEIITLILGLYLSLAILRKKYKPSKYEKNALLCMIVYYVLGAFATLFHNFQNDILYGLESGLFSIKIFVCYFGARAFLWDKRFSKKQLYWLLKVIETPILPIALLLIIDQFIEWFPHTSMRFGVKCSQFIFTHPTELAGFAICSLILTCFIRNILSLKKLYFLNLLPVFVIVVISGRYKALGFLILFASVNVILPFIRKFKLRYFVIGIPPVLLVVYNQLVGYFSDLTLTARGMLYKNSILIAKD